MPQARSEILIQGRQLQGQGNTLFPVVVDLPGSVEVLIHAVGRFSEDCFVYDLHADDEGEPSHEERYPCEGQDQPELCREEQRSSLSLVPLTERPPFYGIRIWGVKER